MVEIAPEFLAVLCCPVSRKPLIQKGDWLVSTDAESRLRYPIRDGIPVLLEEESESLDEATWTSLVGSEVEPPAGS